MVLTVHASNRKGELKPISVVIKIRQGRKACTLITGYETFGVQADELAEELRKTCASSTSGTFPPLLSRCTYEPHGCCSIASPRKAELPGGHGAGQTVQSCNEPSCGAWCAEAVDRGSGSDAHEEKEVNGVSTRSQMKRWAGAVARWAVRAFRHSQGLSSATWLVPFKQLSELAFEHTQSPPYIRTCMYATSPGSAEQSRCRVR